MTAVPAARLRGVVALIGNGEITPTAKRLLLRLCDEYDPPATDRTYTCPTCERTGIPWNATCPCLEPRPTVSPDCAGGHKCTACSGDAWDFIADRPAPCTCACHHVTSSEDVPGRSVRALRPLRR